MLLIVAALFAAALLSIIWVAAKFGVVFYAMTAMIALVVAMFALLVIVAIAGPKDRKAGLTSISVARGWRRRRSDRAGARSR